MALIPSLKTLVDSKRSLSETPSKNYSNRYLSYSEKIAVVEREIVPTYKGRVRFQGCSWLAQCEKSIKFEPGERVVVTGRRNITLLVDALM